MTGWGLEPLVVDKTRGSGHWGLHRRIHVARRHGPDTEAALFGAHESGNKEEEQVAWDKHNLRGAIKRLFTQAVAEAPTVDFAAKTELQSGVLVFVNPAYEKKSLTWKAMYRAGKAPAAAGVEIARAWLKEL